MKAPHFLMILALCLLTGGGILWIASSLSPGSSSTPDHELTSAQPPESESDAAASDAASSPTSIRDVVLFPLLKRKDS